MSIDFQAANFSVKGFVEDVVRKTNPSDSSDDLLPFISNLEKQLNELKDLEAQIDLKLSSIEDPLVSTVHPDHAQVDRLECAWESLGEDLEVAKRVYRVQEQKQRAEHLLRILDCLAEFVFHGKCNVLIEAISSPAAECALTLHEAVKIIKTLEGALDVYDLETKEHVKQFAGVLKSNLQDDFRECVKSGNTLKASGLYKQIGYLEGPGKAQSVFLEVSAAAKCRVLEVYTRYTPGTVVKLGCECEEEPCVQEYLDKFGKAWLEDACVVPQEHASSCVETVLVRNLKPLIAQCLGFAKQHTMIAHQRSLHGIYKQVVPFLEKYGIEPTRIIDTKQYQHDERACWTELCQILKSQDNRTGHFAFTDGSSLQCKEDLEMAGLEHLFVCLAEAAARTKLLCAREAEGFLPILLNNCLHFIFIEQADVLLESATSKLANFDAKPVKLVQSVHTALNLTQIFCNKLYYPQCMQISEECLRRAVKFKADIFAWTIGRLDKLMEVLLHRTVSNCREYLHAGQLEQCWQFLKNVAVIVRQCQEEWVCRRWLRELGVQVVGEVDRRKGGGKYSGLIGKELGVE